MSERVCAPLDQIPDALAKTGFILEHQVAQEFKKAGWATIGGRFYADDVDGRARELDIVAYRTYKSKELDVVTGVLISCKKDEETTWAFLTKDKPKYDPNFDWNPVHYWTDVEPLRSYLASDPWKEKYITSAGKLYDENFRAARDVFAFQQVASLNVAARNDKAIFNSIASLMKALDHEVEAVPKRAKGRKRLYYFSLVSVVDAPMVDVSYSGEAPVAAEVARLTHLARYMVRRRDLSALIHFVRSDKLPQFVAALSKLADFNAAHMTKLLATSYESIRWNEKVRAHFADRLKWRLVLRINQALRKNGIPAPKVEDMRIDFEEGRLKILIDTFDGDELEILNSDEPLKTQTAKLLKDAARYEGDFEFEADFPF
ncbi:hypothetical protein [Marilutibacter spongiae]|uniref:Restriction endonuclease n=1 Tax=Marilutibacter spongiae TaxID=2025720 RepID=A0A7W3TL60_9GAMM|nr:hypothetical protein [Lysobacter spongiae]MBB1060355.1 hypothetical protein [Lysobacter spongiae]